MMPRAAKCRNCEAPIFFGRMGPSGKLRVFDFEPYHRGYAIDLEDGELWDDNQVTMYSAYYRVGEVNGEGQPLFRRHECRHHVAREPE